MSTLKFRTTQRGFALIEFTDRSAQACSLLKSSLAMEEAIWFGVNGAEWMHLTQDKVRELLPALQRFAQTGELL